MKSSEVRSVNKKQSQIIGQVIIYTLLSWALIYNIVVKDQSFVQAVFKIIDTITEDMVMGSLVTVILGMGIVLVFTVTKLYTQIISRASSFRLLEDLFVQDFAQDNYRKFFTRLLNFEEEEDPDTVYPLHPASVLISFSVLYMMSWIYLILFSEALYFVSWSAGVVLPITIYNMELLPTLALAIPFSARVMAYFRYPYTQDYADFMPGAVFVLLLVASLGYCFQSHDQQFFLLLIWEDDELFRAFLRSGLMLAFVPVFSEAIYWMMAVFFSEEESEE